MNEEKTNAEVQSEDAIIAAAAHAEAVERSRLAQLNQGKDEVIEKS